MAAASGQIPDAVVALAQAAAKANGETEKYLPGWPLFSPPKMQLTKCAKCPREFCSSVALRRHSRVHRRALKIDKEFPKNRDHVAAFWDKLTVDQAQAILSLEKVDLEGIKGSSILTALSSWMCKPGYASLPLAYARAGNELLDLIQTRASRLPISSNKLLNILDEASENTFLCTNTADAASVQKYLFDGEVEKVSTELKNVVACTSYILEQKLVEAWSADKAAEALRCQKLLVEEEDAAQKRQAEIMERKRMKKLRQKEQRSKDLKDKDAMVELAEMAEGTTGSPGIQSLDAISGPGLCEEEYPQCLQLPAHATFDSGREMDPVVVTREQPMSTSDLDRLDNARQAGIVSGSGIPSKHPPLARHSRHRDPNASPASNRSGTWAWKVRADVVEERCPKAKLDVEGDHVTVLETDKSSRLLIGSISVAIETEKCLQGSQCLNEPPTPKSHSDIVNHTLVKLMQPASHAKDGCEDTNGGSVTSTAENHSPSSVVTEESSSNNVELAAGGGDSRGGAVFSSKEAGVFLSRRWKEAVGGDHVKLILCSEN
ncbi:unnamed protein product [Alopecurus aequalis]